MCRNRSSEDMACIARAVCAAVEDARCLSAAPAAFGTRVRLLHLAMNILHVAHYPYHAHGAAASRFVSAVASTVMAPALGLPAHGEDSGGGVGGVIDPFLETVDDPAQLFDARSNASRSGTPQLAGGMDALFGIAPGGGPGLGGPGETAGAGAAAVSAAALHDLSVSRSSASLLSTKYSVALSGGLVEVPLPTAGDEAVAVGDSGPEGDRAAGAAAACQRPLFKAVAVDAWVTLSVGSLAVFRERVLRAALAWFALRPSWYESVTSVQRVREDFGYVTGACSSFLVLMYAALVSEEAGMHVCERVGCAGR